MSTLAINAIRYAQEIRNQEGRWPSPQRIAESLNTTLGIAARAIATAARKFA